MALTDAQKHKVRRHLGLDPFDTDLDDRFTQIAADATIEALLTAIITDCDAAETAIFTAYDQNSDLVEGGGARFAYQRHVDLAKKKYKDKLAEMGRIMAFNPENLTLASSGAAYVKGY